MPYAFNFLSLKNGQHPNLALPLIDLRAAPAYADAHWVNATHLPLADLPLRLNELPARPATLQLMGNLEQVADAYALLSAKGYVIEEAFDSSFLTKKTPKNVQKQPGLVLNSINSAILWQPSALIIEFMDLLKANQFKTPSSGVDIGCGGGRDCVYLAKQGIAMTGIEHKENVLSRAKSLAKTNQVEVNWRCCDVAEQACFGKQSSPSDLVVVVRYLNRQLMNTIVESIKPGGWIVFQTFYEGCEAFGSPKNPNFILKNGELAHFFSEFKIFIDRIDYLPDGRPMASFIARKPYAKHDS